MGQDPTPPLSSASLQALANIPIQDAPSPGYVIHLDLLEKNCRLLKSISEESGARILLALKGFACHSTFPLIRRYLSGTTSSGLHEALLAHEVFGPEVHVYSAAYKPEEVQRLSRFAHTLVFNSAQQLARGLQALEGYRRPEIGLRVNPEHSEVKTELYDPCAPSSRLGTTRDALDRALTGLPNGLMSNLDGLHFHALCEQDADALEHTAEAFEAKFGDYLPDMKWLNFGGGHHITRPGYDTERLVRTIRYFRDRYAVDIYLEPGEAVALHTGILVVTVLDLMEAGGHTIAILDSSATCHMPDVLEMPYRPEIEGGALPGEKEHTYRLAGLSCLAGDVIGDYSFDEALKVGDRLVFRDMAHYTMVKTTFFNGIAHPDIGIKRGDKIEIVRCFDYVDYKGRLG
jgi:carboxynorspermidine decarboxylase